MMLRMVESVKSDPNERFCHQNICFEGGGPGFRQQLNNFSNQTKVCLNSPLTSGLDSYVPRTQRVAKRSFDFGRIF